MIQKETRIVAYYRCSTAAQKESGLGLEAQRKAVTDYVSRHGARIDDEITEQESGKVNSEDRKLKHAIALAKAKRAVLCVAKLDRVGRRAADVLKILDDSKIKVVFADSPNASHLENGIRAIIAEEEGKAISARTKAALAAAKARGVKLGNPNGARALLAYQALNGNEPGCLGARKHADEFARDMVDFIRPYIAKGLTNAAIASALNESGIETRQGARWHDMTVRRLRARLAI